MAITPNTTFTSGAILTAAQMNRLPWGVVGTANATANQTGITTVVDVTGLTVTFTADSSRIYRTTAYVFAAVQLTAQGYPGFSITDGANNTKQGSSILLATGFQAPLCVTVYESGLSGSTTRKVRAETNAGTLTLAADAARPMVLIVEDIGQA